MRFEKDITILHRHRRQNWCVHAHKIHCIYSISKQENISKVIKVLDKYDNSFLIHVDDPLVNLSKNLIDNDIKYALIDPPRSSSIQHAAFAMFIYGELKQYIEELQITKYENISVDNLDIGFKAKQQLKNICFLTKDCLAKFTEYNKFTARSPDRPHQIIIQSGKIISDKYLDIIHHDRKILSDNIRTIESTLQRIEINPVELCNRTCVFCPRHDPVVYPNRNLHMSVDTATNLGKSLQEMNYDGRLTFSGFGEPLLHNSLISLISPIRELVPGLERVQVITNGDKLTREIALELYDAGVDRIEIDLYDGEHQVKMFDDRLRGISKDKYYLRHHYYGPEQDYGLTLNNRAGAVDIFEDVKEPLKKQCFLPFYKLMIDWNGDVLLCCQDWQRRGDVNLNVNSTSIKDIWNSSELNFYRKKLSNFDRSTSPCNKCNINGTMNGKESFEALKKHYEF